MFKSQNKRTRAWLRDAWWLLVLGSFLVVAVFVYDGQLRYTPAYKGALAEARTDPELIEAIGSPILEGLFPEGEYLRKNDSSGCWRIEIPVYGPEGYAAVNVIYHEGPDGTGYTFLVADLEDSERRIDLLGEGQSKVVC